MSEADDAVVAKIRANAELAIETLSGPAGFRLGYDEKSLEWVDGYIERVRLGADQAMKNSLISVLGSFLGECVRWCYGGEWVNDDGQWGVAFDARNCAFPFSKVYKQFENGRAGGDSILIFFRVIPTVFKQVRKPPP